MVAVRELTASENREREIRIETAALFSFLFVFPSAMTIIAFLVLCPNLASCNSNTDFPATSFTLQISEMTTGKITPS